MRAIRTPRARLRTRALRRRCARCVRRGGAPSLRVVVVKKILSPARRVAIVAGAKLRRAILSRHRRRGRARASRGASGTRRRRAIASASRYESIGNGERPPPATPSGPRATPSLVGFPAERISPCRARLSGSVSGAVAVDPAELGGDATSPATPTRSRATRDLHPGAARISREDLVDALTCPVSGKLFVDPVTTVCGHSFSRRCLSTWMARTDRAPSCPTCRAPLYHENPRRWPVNTTLVDLVERFLGDELAGHARVRARRRPRRRRRPGTGRGTRGERALALRPRRHHPRAGDHVERVRGAIQTDGSEVSAGIAQVRDGGSDSRRERRPPRRRSRRRPTPPATTPRDGTPRTGLTTTTT